MSRGPEGRFQDRLLDLWRKSGIVCQKFNDLFSEGIPDVHAKLPVVGSKGVQCPWIELKAIASWPKRQTTKLPLKSKPTPAQLRWMNSFATDSAPCWVALNTPDGWIAMDHVAAEEFWSLPISAVKSRLSKDQPTFGRILRSIHHES